MAKEYFDTLCRSWRDGEWLEPEDFIFLCDRHNIALHHRTRDYIERRIKCVHKDAWIRSRCRSNRSK